MFNCINIDSSSERTTQRCGIPPEIYKQLTVPEPGIRCPCHQKESDAPTHAASDQYWHHNRCSQTSSSRLKCVLTPLFPAFPPLLPPPFPLPAPPFLLAHPQYPPSPPATCRPSRSTRRPSVSRGRPRTLSSSTASTRATRSVAAAAASIDRTVTAELVVSRILGRGRGEVGGRAVGQKGSVVPLWTMDFVHPFVSRRSSSLSLPPFFMFYCEAARNDECLHYFVTGSWIQSISLSLAILHWNKCTPPGIIKPQPENSSVFIPLTLLRLNYVIWVSFFFLFSASLSVLFNSAPQASLGWVEGGGGHG